MATSSPSTRSSPSSQLTASKNSTYVPQGSLSSAPSSSSSSSNHHLDCPVCLERYDETDHQPRILPCGHILCSMDLKALLGQKGTGGGASKQPLQCPECRAPLPSTSNASDSSSSPSSSPSLKEYPICYPLMRGASTIKPQLTATGQRLCTKQDHELETLTVYCRTCAMALCSKCLCTPVHSTHFFAIVPLSDHLASINQRVEDLSRLTAKELEDPLARGQVAADAVAEAIRKQLGPASEKLQALHDRLLEAVEERVDALRARANFSMKGVQKRVELQTSKLAASTPAARQAQITQLRQHLHAFEIAEATELTDRPLLNARELDLTAIEINKQLSTVPTITYSEDEEKINSLLELIKNMGAIKLSPPTFEDAFEWRISDWSHFRDINIPAYSDHFYVNGFPWFVRILSCCVSSVLFSNHFWLSQGAVTLSKRRHWKWSGF